MQEPADSLPRDRHSSVPLLERDDGAGTNALGNLPQSRGRVSHEHEYQPSHSANLVFHGCGHR